MLEQQIQSERKKVIVESEIRKAKINMGLSNMGFHGIMSIMSTLSASPATRAHLMRQEDHGEAQY